MPQETQWSPEHTRRYRNNLAAFQAFQSSTADVVDGAPIPGGVEPAKGRDGADTFLITTADGRREWFGGSSMPTISAREILANFQADGRSVSLPGVFTGLEPILLAAGLPAHGYVLVTEADPLRIKLALHLHDYTGLISAGRIVFALEADLEHGLCEFFRDHPGYDVPQRLVTVPHLSTAEAAKQRRRVEQAVEAVCAMLGKSAEALARAVAGRARGSLPEKPRIALVGTDAAPASLDQGRRLAKALETMCWPHVVCIPDSPDKCHVVARLRAVERIDADMVLLISATAGQLGSHLPADLPITSWYLPGANVPATVIPAHVPEHTVFACSCTMRDQLISAGVSPDRVELCEPGIDETMRTNTDNESSRPTDVAVLMDLPDDRPEAVNVTLDSHLTLWRAMQDVVARSPDRFNNQTAAKMLQEAERVSGTTLVETSVRDRFLMLFKAMIAPVRVARADVDALIEEGLRVALYGAQWSRIFEGRSIARGMIPLGEDLRRVLGDTSIVVSLDLSAWSVQTALDALAAGAAPICRGTAESFRNEYPGLAELVPRVHFYTRRDELIKAVRSVTSAEKAVGTGPSPNGIGLLPGHTIADRLQAIVRRLRGR